MIKLMKRTLMIAGTTVLVAGSAIAGSTHSTKTAKFTPKTFICRHGCKQKITVKTAADMKKICPVCGCKKTIAQCMPTGKAMGGKKAANSPS